MYSISAGTIHLLLNFPDSYLQLLRAPFNKLFFLNIPGLFPPRINSIVKDCKHLLASHFTWEGEKLMLLLLLVESLFISNELVQMPHSLCSSRFLYYNGERIYMQKEVIEKVAALITAAFGLVAALAWNTAIQEIFRLIFGEQSGIWAMIAYAVIVTIIAVVVTIWIGRVAEKSTGRKLEST